MDSTDAFDGTEKMRPGPGTTLVSHLVQQLEALSMAHPDGALLGSEDTLLARFGVSRPTLRQAAKVVEAKALISVRRGLRGGFYATRPDAAHAIGAPARYLRLHDATLRHMHEMSRVLLPQAAALAAACQDEALRDEVRRFRGEIDRRDVEDDSVTGMIASETTLSALVSRMTYNPVIVLFMQIAFEFGDLERDHKFYRDPADRALTRALQRKLCDALLAGDAEAARQVNMRRAALVQAWIARGEGTSLSN